MFTTLFFILLLAYFAMGGDKAEIASYGCVWLLLCFCADVATILLCGFLGVTLFAIIL